MADPIVETTGSGNKFPSTITEIVSQQQIDAINRAPRAEKVDLIVAALKTGHVLVGVDMESLDFRGKDLSGAKMTDCQLTHAKLARVDLSGSTLTNINFTGSNLDEANLVGSWIEKSSFESVHAERACFADTIIKRSGFAQANLKEATFREAGIQDCDLPGVNLSDAIFTSAILEDNNMRSCNLDKADFSLTELTEMAFKDSSAKGAIFTDTKIKQTIFDYVDLTNSAFQNAVMDGVRFRGGSLARASMAGVEMKNADFQNMDLSRTNFSSGIINDSAFVESKTEGAAFTYALIHDTKFRETPVSLDAFQHTTMINCSTDTVPIISKAQEPIPVIIPVPEKKESREEDHICREIAAGKDITGADLRGLDFSGRNMEGAKIHDCNMDGANFTGANLKGVKMTRCGADGANFTAADLSGCYIAESDLLRANFDKASLSRGLIDCCLMNGASFNDSSLESTLIRETDLSRVLFADANMKMTILEDVKLKMAEIISCDLRTCEISGSTLATTNFEDCLGAHYGEEAYKEAVPVKASRKDLPAEALPLRPAVGRLQAGTPSHADFQELHNRMMETRGQKSRAAFLNSIEDLGGFKVSTFSDQEKASLIRGGKSEVKVVYVEMLDGTTKVQPRRYEITPKGEIILHTKAESPLDLKNQEKIVVKENAMPILDRGRAYFDTNCTFKKEGNVPGSAWMQIDKELNRLVIKAGDGFVLPEKILGRDLTPHHQELKETGAAQVDGLLAKNGNQFSALLEVDLIRGKLSITPDLSISKAKAATLGQTEGEAKREDPVQKNNPALISQVPEAETEKEVRRGGPRR